MTSLHSLFCELAALLRVPERPRDERRLGRLESVFLVSAGSSNDQLTGVTLPKTPGIVGMLVGKEQQ